MDYNYLANLLYPDVKYTTEELELKYPPRKLPEGAVVSRHAPSPTGFVHLGNVVQSLISERLAHQSGGVMFLRIEDTDSSREVEGAVPSLVTMLSYYGINFDEGVTADGERGDYGPYTQSQRRDIYAVYAKKLVSEGKAYPCFCTPEELAEAHAAQEAAKENFGYYGKWALWRDRSIEDIEAALAEGKPWVLRVRADGDPEKKIKFTDLVKGPLELPENDNDYVIMKSDGIPPYHFAHPIDDHLMHTTHIVRGDEWLATFPLHYQLHMMLGFKLPKYVHIGTLNKMDGTSKRKLSKRKDPEFALTYYSALGFPVESFREYFMTVLNSNFEDWRRANPDADINTFKFSAKKLNPAGMLFDGAKLADISKNVVSKMSAEKVYGYLTQWAEQYDPDFAEKLKSVRAYTISLLSIGRGTKKPRKDFGIWSEVRAFIGFFYDEYFKIEDEYPENFSKSDIIAALSAFAAVYDEADNQTVWFDKIKAVADSLGYASDMKAYKQSPESYKGNVGDVSMFLRVAVTGRLNSPDMFEVMKVLGKERVVTRLTAMAEKLG